MKQEKRFMDKQISRAIVRFTDLVRDLPDAELEREWAWGSYKSEGIRFTYFRNFEDLRQLAIQIEHVRAESDRPISDAERILAGYHAAYRDLQVVLSGVEASLIEAPPAEGEWSIRRVYAHILGADMGFYVAIKFALDRYQQGEDPLVEIDDETWLNIIGMEDDDVDARMSEPLPDLRSFHKELHARILKEFAGITDQELEVHAKFWEEETYSLGFRLQRFEAHMRQHTIQIEKTLQALDHTPSESQRLLRLIYAALTQVEGGLIGAEDEHLELLSAAALLINERTDEVEAILAN
jgi:uncharacterized damage-inducible protein DinB